MNDHKAFLFRFILAAVIPFSAAYAGPEEDLTLVSSTERGLILQFAPDFFRIDTLRIQGETYHRVDFRGASPWIEISDPSVPARVVTVGVPREGDVRVEVDAGPFRAMSGVRLPPVPQVRNEGGLPRQVYREGPVYRGSDSFPGRLYRVEEPGYFGEQRIVRIHLYPVQYDPAAGGLRVYEKMTVRVGFPATHPEGEVGSNRRDPLYRKVLINPEVARRWRRAPRKALAKPGALSGEVYKIPVSREGLYRITGNLLEGAGIDLGLVQTATLKIYNNGGRELPRDIGTARPDSLIENPILVFGMEDGRFDPSDSFVFYGQDVNGWEYDPGTASYSHYIHHYDTRNVYWLVFNDGIQGRRADPAAPLPSEGAPILEAFRDRHFVEPELNNPLHAGIHWFGPSFDNTNAIESYTLTLQDLVEEDTLHFRFRFKGHSSGTHRFTAALNEGEIGSYSFVGSTIREIDDAFVGGQEGTNTLSFLYSGSSSASLAYLDWYELAYSRRLTASEGRLRFFSPSEAGRYAYRLGGFGEEPILLDVTDISAVRRMELESVNGGYAFVDDVTDTPRRYIAVTEADMLTPGDIEPDETSDLRNPSNGADLIIVSHRDFLGEAVRLKDHRETYDSLSVFIADIQDVYDEFSWGLSDPTAIRDFVKHAFDSWAVRPSYLLLFGDGDYDYKNVLMSAAEKRIPPFEFDGLSESGSRASDDWYTYISGNDSHMDLAVGRLAVQTVAEAATVVDKIISYETALPNGRWKSLITLVGDDEKAQHGDENETVHTQLLENLAETRIPAYYNLKKIYMTEYPEVTTAEGRRKPQAAADLLEQINQGTILVDYSGHGNDELWAHERVFVQGRDLPAMRNEDRLPLFYAATCDFAHYDDPLEQSFSEDLVNTEGKGAVAVIAASRFCNATSNLALNREFLESLFDESGISRRLGDALRAGKMAVASRSNNEMYHILGDPTMRLALPRHRAEFTRMEPDSFKALSVVQAEGEVRRGVETWTEFSGELSLEAYDSEKEVVYTTAAGARLYYVLPGNALFRGTAAVDAGRFEVSFIVPKDISYGGDSGRLHVYFADDARDGVGYRDGIPIGGSAFVQDGEGPVIAIAFTGQEAFITGDMVTGEPELSASIRDEETGINITGEIGHKLMLTLDGEEKQDVTEYFRYDEGSYLQGTVRYRLSGLEEGDHDLELKAWDNANNSSTQSVMFRLVAEGDLRLEEVLNYPNPFRSTTHFTFKLSRDADVEIKVFTVDGLLVRRIDEFSCLPGFNMVSWDGRDDVGDEIANGVYLYRVVARAAGETGELSSEAIGRLMIIR